MQVAGRMLWQHGVLLGGVWGVGYANRVVLLCCANAMHDLTKVFPPIQLGHYRTILQPHTINHGPS